MVVAWSHRPLPRPFARPALAALLLIVPALSPSIARGLEIDSGLRGTLSRSASGEMDLVIVLEDQLDASRLEEQVAGLPFQDRRESVIRALQDHARRTQRALLGDLQVMAGNGVAHDPRGHWLANVVFVRGGDDLIAALAAHPARGWVSRDPERAMIEAAMPGESSALPPNPIEAGASRATMTVWSLDWIHAPGVWDQGLDGTGVLIGHIDSGAWLEHPDLANRLWVNPGEITANGIDDDGNGYVDDVNGWDFGDRDSDPNDDNYYHLGGGHGTHTAGTVVGDGTGGIHTGVAPGARIVVCKVTQNESGLASFSSVFEAHEYSVLQGVRLITMSMGVGGGAPAAVLQAERRVGDHLRLLGVPLFAAAGNDHRSYSPPNELSTSARVPSPWSGDPTIPYSSRSGIISIGATAYMSDTIWENSSQGPADWAHVLPWDDWRLHEGNGLVKPDVSAPGNGISSLLRPSGYSQTNWSGTSMATPHVAGTAALMLQKNPSLMPAEIDRILQQTAVDLGVPGKDNVFGSGRIDALAAVNAVPASVHPSLVIEDSRIVDANGNGSIDPGELFSIDLSVLNNSFTTDAGSIMALFFVPGDEFVQEAGPTRIALGDLAHGSALQTGEAIQLRASSEAAQGHEFELTVILSSEEGYSEVFDLPFFVGFPELRTHRPEGVRLTVTDRGTLGWWDMNHLEGVGFVPSGKGGQNLLWSGGLWAGNSATYLCNRDNVPTDRTEWGVTTSPNGRLAPVSLAHADEHFRAVFDDGLHPQSRGVRVTQESMSWADADAADFVILSYEIENTGPATLPGYRAGVFMDWDFYYPFYTRSGKDLSRNLVFTNDVYITGEHAGVRVLDPAPGATLAVIHNPTYQHPNLQILDEDKWDIMSGALDSAVGDTDDDWSTVAATGAFDLAPGEKRQVAFAVVYGESLEDLRTNSDRALARYLSAPTGTGATPPQHRFRLSQNLPNPFNPSTRIDYELEEEGKILLRVVDLRGRTVRVLESGTQAPGPHSVIWNGTDARGDRVASGVYFCRLECGGSSATRKMILVK